MDEHPKDIEDVWSTLCLCWPNNLKVIIRYLVIISGMAPHELLPYVSIKNKNYHIEVFTGIHSNKLEC